MSATKTKTQFRQAEFTFGVNAPEAMPKPSLPEVALWGRSNAGKSSLLNALCQHKGLARVSHTPGRTQQLNFFRIHNFFLVDLPGYGFAKVSGEKKFAWLKLTRFYVEGRRTLRLIVLLIDARRGLTPVDRDVLAALDELGHPYALVMTKTDQLKKPELKEAHATLLGELDELRAAHREVIMTSSKTGEGLDDLRVLIAGTAQS